MKYKIKIFIAFSVMAINALYIEEHHLDIQNPANLKAMKTASLYSSFVTS